MTKVIALIGNFLGIGGKIIENRQKIKELKQEQEFKIIEAETTAVVNRIRENNVTDNEIDLITARNKKYTYKDEVITYLFLIPVIVASITPFIISFTNKDFTKINSYVLVAYNGLSQLPDWYKYVLGAIVIDVLGFRSFARKVFETFVKNKLGK